MALKIIREKPAVGELLADRRLFLTADKSRVVEEGDAGAAYLFATPGSPITQEDIDRYGLSLTGGPNAEAAQAAEPSPDKRGAGSRKRG